MSRTTPRALIIGLATAAALGTGAAAVAVSASGSSQATAVAAVKPAGHAVVSLSGWKLTLPVNSSGCQCGSAAQLNPARLVSPWLTQNSVGLAFWAPAKGATTPNSKHARTELVSLNEYVEGSGTHTLKVTEFVQQVPTSGDITIGQIHGGGSTSSIPLLMFHYLKGTLTAATRNSASAQGLTWTPVLAGVPMNSTFSFTITQDTAGTMLVTAKAGTKSGKASIPLPPSFKSMVLRFQVGDYQQDPVNNSTTDGGRLTISSLSQN